MGNFVTLVPTALYSFPLHVPQFVDDFMVYVL